jgi:hypothetical protein
MSERLETRPTKHTDEMSRREVEEELERMRRHADEVVARFGGNGGKDGN